MEQDNPSPPSAERRQLAEYAMAFDVIARIAGLRTERRVIEQIFEFFSLMCAPARMAYLPMVSGRPGTLFVHPENAGGADLLQDRLMRLEGVYELTGSGRGFVLRIHLEQELLGMFEVEEIAFPQHLHHYLNLGVQLVSCIALAVANARNFEQLQYELAERSRAEENIRRHNLILDGINRIFQNVLSHSTEEKLGEGCLSIAEEITGSRFGFIGEIGQDGLLHDIAISNPGWELCSMHDKTGHRRPPGNFPIHGLYGKVLTDGKGFFTNVPSEHPDRIGLPAGHPPLNAFLGVPLFHEGRTIGMIAMGNREGGYGRAQQEALEALAPAILEAFKRKRTEDALQQAHSDLLATNKELEAFSYSVSHDLRAPLRSIEGFGRALLEDEADRLSEAGKDSLGRIRSAAAMMSQLIDALLRLSRLTRTELKRSAVSLTALVRSVIEDLGRDDPSRQVDCAIADNMTAEGDAAMLHIVVTNLLQNAWKFTGKQAAARIEFSAAQKDGKTVYSVRDNGAGFDMAHADRLFMVFQRLHSAKEFAGIGIGLATVQRIIHRHGGRIWAEGAVDQGATFYFTLS